MVTLVNTHTASVQNVPSVQDTITHLAQSCMKGLSDALIAAGWTLQISCDASSVNTSGTNLWTANSAIVWNSGGSAHSYQVFISPSGMIGASGNQIRVLLACSTGSANPHLINVTWGSGAFTSSGSVNTDPTSPANARTISNQQILQSTVANSHFHYEYVSAGTEVGNINFLISRDGTGLYQFGFSAEASHGYNASDNWAVYCYNNYTTTNRGAFTRVNFTSTTNTTSFWTDSTVTSSGAFYTCALDVAGSVDFMTQFTSTGSSIDGSFPDFPISCWSSASSKIAQRGYIVDAAWSNGPGTSVNQATQEPSSGTVTTSIVGDRWLAGNWVSAP